MDWKKHIMIGIIISILALSTLKNMILNYHEWILLGIITIVYSILPDIDHQSSKITWWVLCLLTISHILTYYFYQQYLVYSLIMQLICVIFINMPHRGFTHSLIANVLAILPLFMITHNPIIIIIGLLAYWSHLLADGIPFKISGSVL